MRLRIQYTAQLRNAAGCAEEDVELPDGCSLAALLAHLAGRSQEIGRHLLTDSGQAQPSLLVAINGSAMPALTAAATRVNCGDVVTLLPPIAGG